MANRENEVMHKAALVLLSQSSNPVPAGESGFYFDGTHLILVNTDGSTLTLGSALSYGAAGDMAANGAAASNSAGVSTKVARTDHVHAVSIGSAELAAGAVVAAALGANAVTGPALSATAERLLAFAGHNGAGACTATGVKVGDTVVGVIDLAAASVSAAASFESTITVNDQIQQSSASDLHLKNYALLVVAKS